MKGYVNGFSYECHSRLLNTYIHLLLSAFLPQAVVSTLSSGTASPSRQLKSPSTDTVHNFLISVPGNRVSNTNSKGIACIFAVSENANESIGAAGFSDRRNAHKTYAVLMKMDLFATCSPGQILRAVPSRRACTRVHRRSLTCVQSRMCRNVGHLATFHPSSTNVGDQTCQDSGTPPGRWQSP